MALEATEAAASASLPAQALQRAEGNATFTIHFDVDAGVTEGHHPGAALPPGAAAVACSGSGIVSEAMTPADVRERSPAGTSFRSGGRTPGGRNSPTNIISAARSAAFSRSSLGTVAGWQAHCCYHLLAFFVYWFGAARFDMNGDGEFDPTDVQRMINNVSRHVHLSFSRPKPRRRRLRQLEAQRRQELERERARWRRCELDHEKHMREIRAQMEQAQGGEGRRPSVTSLTSASVSLQVERVSHSVDTAFNASKNVMQASVEGECVESTIQDNLRQYWPWFTVGQVVICFGLWLGYALQTNPYTEEAQHALLDASLIIEELSDLQYQECEMACSSMGDECAGLAWLQGPAPRCRLLSAVPEKPLQIPSCLSISWNWSVHRKQPRTIARLLSTMGGLESAFPGQTGLLTQRYCQEDVAGSIYWRVLTYQFTHKGLGHAGANCLMLLFLGIPLEGFHGTGLTALMYSVGVVGGGLNWMLMDPYRKGFGVSGGCYALLGMHLADLVLNWRQKKYRYAIIVMLSCIIGAESFGYISSLDEGEVSNVAHSVHMGGIIAGLLIGVLLGRNIEKMVWERALQVIAMLIAAGIVCLCLSWWFTMPFPAIRSLWYLGEEPICWIGQVCTNADGTGCDILRGWQCVTCDSRECVENWYKDEHTFCVTAGNENVCENRYSDFVHNCQNC